MLTIPRYHTKEAIAEYLKINIKIVSEVLDFLVSVGLASRSGNKFTTGASKIHLEKDSPLISKHHTNWRIAAIKSFENEVAEDLHFSSVFTLSEKDAHGIRSSLLKTIENAVGVIKDSKEESTMAMTMDLFKI